MTLEELKAELEKIIRMEAGVEPVDLRYDVNKDNRVNIIDALALARGQATVPTVTTTPPKTIPPVTTTPPTTTATVTTTAPDAYQKQLDADALARGRERYVLEAEKILGRKLTPEEATALGQAAYPEIQRYTDPKTGAKSYMFPYYDVGSYFRDKLTDEEKQRLDRLIDSSVINAAQQKFPNLPLGIEEQERLKGLYGYEDALTYGGVNMPLDSQGNPKFLSALSASDLYNEIVSGVTARQAAENQAAADRAVYDAARLEGRAYNGTIYETKEAAQKAFLVDAIAQGRVYNGIIYATKEGADFWKSIDDEFARIKGQEAGEWWADLKFTINSGKDPNILGEVLNYPQYQAYINGKYWNKVIYNTKEEADQARQADINKARSEGRLLYDQYFFPTKEALEQAKTLSYEDPDSPAFVERTARLSKALSDAARNQKPWNQWTDYASKYGLTKDDAPEFALPELQKIDPIIKDGKDITDWVLYDLSKIRNGFSSLGLRYEGLSNQFKEKIVANDIADTLNSYGIPKEKHADYIKRAWQEDTLDYATATGIYSEGNKPTSYSAVLDLKRELTTPTIYHNSPNSPLIVEWYTQNTVPLTRNELLQIPPQSEYTLQDGGHTFQGGSYSAAFAQYKDKLVEQARKKFGDIDQSTLVSIANELFNIGITDLDNVRAFSSEVDGEKKISLYDVTTGKRFRDLDPYSAYVSGFSKSGRLTTTYALVPQADGTFGTQVHQEKEPGEWVQFRDEFLKPAAMFALAVVPGINTAIGSAIGFTTPSIAQAAGSFVMNTAIQVASGVPIGDALKNAAIRVAVPEIIPDLTNSPFINKVIDSAATSIALGTPVETAVTNAAITIAANEISSKLDITNKLGLGSAGGKLITELAVGAMSGKPLEQILTQAALSTALSTTVDTIATENKLTPEEKAVLTVAANAAVQAARTGKINPYQLAMQLNTISGNKKEAAKVVASEAQNLPRSNTAIGAIAVDGKGELYTMDDDGNRMSLTGVDAGRVYTPDEWTSIQTALNAGQAQYVNSLIGAMNNGTMKPEEVVQDLKSAGYSDDTISKIQQANQQFIDRANKAQQLAKDYSEVGSDIDRDNAIKQLEGLGFKPADATRYIDNIDRQVAARNDYANIARDFVANNLGTSEQAITKLRDSLANVGVTGDQQDEVVDAYNKMRLQAAGSDLTPSEMTNLAVLAANKTNWVALPGKSGHEVAFALTDEGDPYVVAARDKDGNNLLNVYQNLTPQGVMQVVNAQLAQSRAAEQTKGAPNQYAVDKEVSDAASAAGLVRTTGMIRNNFSTVNTDYFNNLLRQYSAMSPEDRAKIASASGVTTDLRVLKDIDAQYKAIDQQYAAAVANNSPAAKLYKSLDTRVENKAGYYYTNNGVQPSTAMAMAVQDLQGGNLFNRVNLSEVQDSKFPFETKEFINQFRGTPAGDTLANVLSSAYAVAGSAAANTLNGALGINLHIAEAMGMDTFANDFRKLATGIKTAGDDAIAIANASTDAHKNLIGGLSNVVSAIPWLATGVAPGIVAGAMATTYGNEYIQGRLAGQSIDDAGKRATLMAIAEGIGERIGADEAVRLLKPLWRTTPTDQLGKVIGDSLVNQIGKYGTKEQLGELLSYSLQAGVDKTPQIGLAQDMTGMEFIKGALDTIQQTFVAAGANSGLAVGLRGNMTQDNSGSIKVISPDGSQGLVELGNGSVIRVDIPTGLDLKVGEDININALMHDAVYVPDNVNERFNTLESQIKDIYQTELGRPPTFAELDFNVRRLADGTDIQTVANELNNSQAGQLLDQRNTFNAQTDQQIAANAKSLLDQGRTTYAEFKDFMNTMGLASDRQLNVLDTITPRANVAGTVTSIIGDNAVVTGTDGQMYTMLRVAPNNYLIQVGDQVNLGVSTVKPDATPTVEVTTKIADVIAASVSKSTSISLSQSVSEAAVSTSISKSQSLSVSYSQSQSLSASTSVSVSESQSKSISLSQSVSTVELEKSISLSKSVSTSLSTSASLSTSTSLSQSVSASTSTSQSLSASISKAVSISEALSLSASVSEQMEMDRLKGLSISASLSESISQAVSVSESISKAVSISESTSASISTSQSISQATSISQSLSASTSQSESVSKATSISASVSASTSASLSASTSQSISLSQEVSKQVSISQSTSQSIALSQSLSQSQAVSVSASVSESVSKSASTSLSLSQSTSAALSTSVSQSLSLSQKMSEDIVRGLSISASLSASESVSQSVSRLVSASISTSQSTSTSLSLSESISKATQLSISNSLSASASVSQSQSLSASQSVSKALSQSVSQSLSLSESVAQSISQSLSLSAFQSQSLSVSEQIERDRAVGISISNSLSQSVSLEASKSQSISISTSTQQSISNAVSLSESVSISTYLSQEVSRQTSLSQSLSTANSLSLSLSQSQSLSQSLSQAQTVSITPSITQTVSVTETIAPTATVAPSVTESITQTVTQSVTESITEVITQSLTEALTPSLTATITQLPTLAPTITASATIAPSISVTETFTQTPSLTMVITTTSLPPVTTTITIPPVTTSELVTTEQVTTITIPPVTPPPTSGTIPPVTTPSISVPDQTTTAPITTLPVTTAPITTAVTTARPPTTTARPPTTTARPPTTTARPGGLPFPIFGIPPATGQQTTYIDYAQPKVPAPEFGPYDLFKAPSYLRPLQDSGNFGLAALIGAASESQQRNGDNQSQQNAESQGQAPTG